jgi:hypothetical protein
MISYELAKQLKDAGFPYKYFMWGEYELQPPNQDLRFPTLEELIEACGDDFRSLDFTLLPSKAWHAVGTNASPTHTLTYFHASTPTEAVARLWLALNKK